MHMETLTRQTPYFWIDDVYITGFIASKLGVQFNDLNDDFDKSSYALDAYLDGRGDNKTLIGYPNIDVQTLYSIWNETLRRRRASKT